MRRKGFTLVDLMVTLCMIAILVAMLLPVFARARDKARQTGCQNNLKEISLAALMYAEDNNRRLPRDRFGLLPGGSYTWRAAILPYHRQDFYTCPSAWQLVWKPGEREIHTKGGYGINTVHSNPGPPVPPAGQDRNAIVSEETTILFADQSGWRIAYASNSHNYMRRISLPPEDPQPSERHLGGANYAYCDGHVKWRKPRETACPTKRGPLDLCPWSTGIVSIPTPVPEMASVSQLAELRLAADELQQALDKLNSRLADANQPQPVEKE